MKKQNGITLISLIITIIIMLILAGVSLSMVMGDGSMLEQANAATDKTAAAEVQEYVDLAVAGNKAAKYSNIGYQSKEAVATQMVAEGFINEEQKNAMMNNEEVIVHGQVLDYSGLNEATANVIEFTIDGTAYTVEEGTIWEEWVVTHTDFVINSVGNYIVKTNPTSGMIETPDGDLVVSTDPIEALDYVYARSPIPV